MLGRGVGGLAEPDGDLDFGNSGTGTRLMMGVIAGHDMRVRMMGDASLSRRPMGRVLKPLKQMGLEVEEDGKDTAAADRCAARADLLPIEYRLPVASAQIKSAVLIAGLHAAGRHDRDRGGGDPRPHRAHAAPLRRRGDRRRAQRARGPSPSRATPSSRAATSIVPGDPSSAAFLAAAALIVPGSEITIEGVLVNPTRTGFYVTLAEMGADVAFRNEREEGGEPVADIRGAALQAQGRARAARARAQHDRRIPDAGLPRRLRRRARRAWRGWPSSR